MKKLIVAAILLLASGLACAQSSPGWSRGVIPNAAEWNSEWASKLDNPPTQAVTINLSGGTPPNASNPGTGLTIVAPVGTTGAISMFSAAGSSGLLLHRADGTYASPTVVQNGESLGFIGWRGYDGVTFTPASSAFIQGLATENWSSTAHGADLDVETTPNGSTSRRIVATFGQDASFSNVGPVAFATGTAIPAGGSAQACISATATANFGVCFGAGAPTLSAAKGSLYLRSDGSSTSTRAYVNTDGGTTWTNLVTGS